MGCLMSMIFRSVLNDWYVLRKTVQDGIQGVMAVRNPSSQPPWNTPIWSDPPNSINCERHNTHRNAQHVLSELFSSILKPPAELVRFSFRL